jgi:hypothetical protein
MHTTRLVLLLALALTLAPAHAAEPRALPDSTADDRTSVAVTVYNVNLALVRETRELSLPEKGEATLRFMDVPSSINPRTVHFESLTAPDALAVLEQNYEFDLISPSKLMEKYVGRDVTLIEQAEDLTTREVQATLLSVNGGPVYRVGDRIVLNQTGKVTLGSVPPDLVPRPTLVWTLGADKAGKHDVQASYLTDNMNWSADYVAVVDAEDEATDLTGWVTIDNRSGATYRDATLKLVAGDVRRLARPQVAMAQYDMMERKAARTPQFEEESFFEYHLYTLDRPTTIKDNQTKQLNLMQASGIPLTKKLLLVGNRAWYRNQYGTLTQNEKVAVILEFDNTEAAGLGIPLPKGTVRVYKQDRSGSEQFVGEDAIDHTPRDETISLRVGDAFDVVADRTQTDFRKLSPRQAEIAFEISIRNRKDEDVTVTVREPMGGDWQLLESNIRGAQKKDAGTLQFEVDVAARQEFKLTYRVRVTW